MKLIRVLAMVALSVLGAQTAAHSQSCSEQNIGSSNGCYEATHPAYIIFGNTSGLGDLAKTIAYKGGGLDVDQDTAGTNVDLNGTGMTLLSGTSNAIAFVQDGTLGLRANAASTFTVTVPMLSDGTRCTPAFAANGLGSRQIDGSDVPLVGVVANFNIQITSDVTDGISSPNVEYTIAASGGGLLTDETGVEVDCPSSAGVNQGSIKFDLNPTQTTEYVVEFDIGFETDGSKGATYEGSNFVTVGADGEPAADIYELTLGVAVDTADGAIGGVNRGGSKRRCNNGVGAPAQTDCDNNDNNPNDGNPND